MGTEARIVLYARDRAHADSAATAAFERIASIDRALSDYRIDSEVAAVAAAAGHTAIVASEELVRVLAAALSVARETEGAFDPSAGPLTVLWREARRAHRLPDDTAVAHALRLVDWRCIDLDPHARTVRLARRGMRLDFGGIAKGFAADEALAALRAHDSPAALIAFGGEIVTGDPPPDETGWTIALYDGTERRIANAAMSTSGDAEQFTEIAGIRYSHVLDPRTGWPLTEGTAATVIAADGMTADALATAITVMDSTARETFMAERPDVTFYLRRRRP